MTAATPRPAATAAPSPAMVELYAECSALVAEAQVLGSCTTDSAFTDLACWLVWQQQSRTQPPTERRPANTHPRLARPEGRRIVHPYVVPR